MRHDLHWLLWQRFRRDNESVAAERLLFVLLPEQERHRYHRQREIMVTGSAGGQYLIKRGFVANIYRLPGRTRLCAHPYMTDTEPPETAMIAQILAIRTDEERFLATALPA